MSTTYETPSLNHKTPILSDAGFYADIRFDANDAAPDYIGLHPSSGAATDGTDPKNWKVYKFTYSGSDVTRIQLAYGAWNDRVALFT